MDGVKGVVDSVLVDPVGPPLELIEKGLVGLFIVFLHQYIYQSATKKSLLQLTLPLDN